MYYSRDGQRELLTHNLLEDGINPTSSVTAQWNIELAKFLQDIRNSVTSDFLPQNMGRFEGESSANAFGSGDTRFNYGTSGNVHKRQPDDSLESYTKRSRLEDSLVTTLGSQPESVQKNLAMGMLKFISDNLGEGALTVKSSERQSLLDRPDFGQSNSGTDLFGQLHPDDSGFGHRGNSYMNTNQSHFKNSGYSSRYYDKNRHSSASLPSSSFGTACVSTNTSYTDKSRQNFSRISDHKRKFNLSSQSNMSSSSRNPSSGSSRSRWSVYSAKSSTRTRGRKKAKSAKISFDGGNPKSAGGKSLGTGKANQAIATKSSNKELLSDSKTKSKKVANMERYSEQERDSSISSKQLQPEKSEVVKAGVSLSKGSSSKTDSGEPVTVQVHIDPELPAVTDAHASDTKGKSNPEQAHECVKDGSHKTLKVLSHGTISSAESRTKQVSATSKHSMSNFHSRMLGRDMFGSVGNMDALGNMQNGLPFLFKSILCGTEPYIAIDNHKVRSDYVMMTTKRSKQAKFYRIMADYDDKPQDKLGIVTSNLQRFPAFDSKKDLGDRDILPSVAYLRTNQWNPGSEKINAPMTKLQKLVATFNTNLYQLQKMRVALLDELSKNNDVSICLPISKSMTPQEKLQELLVQPSPATMSNNTVQDSTLDKSSDDKLCETGDTQRDVLERKDKFVDTTQNLTVDEEFGKDDDWTDLEEPNEIELFHMTTDTEKPSSEKADNVTEVKERTAEDTIAYSNDENQPDCSMDIGVQDSDQGYVAALDSTDQINQSSATTMSNGELSDTELSVKAGLPVSPSPDQYVEVTQIEEEPSPEKESCGILREAIKPESTAMLPEPLAPAPADSTQVESPVHVVSATKIDEVLETAVVSATSTE